MLPDVGRDRPSLSFLLYFSRAKLKRDIRNSAETSIMKICPNCQRQYTDETMKFCLDDGGVLISELPPTQYGSADATLQMPANAAEQAMARSTQPSPPPQPTLQVADAPPFMMSARASESVSEPRRGVGVWVVLGALILAVGGIAVALIVTFGKRGNETSNATANAATSPTPDSVAAQTTTTNANQAKESTQQTATNLQVNRQKETATPAKAPPKPAAESTPRPEPQEPAAPRGPISGGVLNGRAVSLVKPAYPAIARSVHASGQVSVQVLIDESGNVISASAVSGHPLLRSSAVSAARASKFSPTRVSGQPVKVSGVIVYNFEAQ